jgi:translation initiation factor IF-2
MRERGANATDIVILVVAADDGVMPQTIEAIQHSKAAGVPIIVAVNKIDKEDADPDRVKTELGNQEVIPEEWGGENMFVNVSAMTGQGVDALLDAILLQAELLELRAATAGKAKGVVLESSLDKGRGVTTTVLVQEGTLNKGDILLAGEEFGRVRAMFDENGKPAESAGPSIPVAVIGLSGTPSAGDDVLVVDDERTAREVAQNRRNKKRDKRLASQQQAKLDSLFDQMKSGEVSTLNVLLKADVQGTLEAIRDALIKLAAENDEVNVNIVGSGVGGINETDISLAAASNAIVIGFNVRADASARRAASERGVELNYYSIIYELIDEVKKALVGMLEPEYREHIIGLAEVKDVFKSPQFGAVAGSIVTEGVIKRNQPIRVLRDNVVIYEGELESLRRFKDDVQEVKSGTECGIAVKNYNDVKVGDQIEVYERVEQERTL